MLHELIDGTCQDLNERQAIDWLGCKMGYVEHISEDGQVTVDFDDNSGPPRFALILSCRLNEKTHDSLKEGDAVLLSFINGTMPVVMGVLSSKLEAKTKPAPPVSQATEVREIVMNAKEQISLTCGDSSITLRRDGKIVVKGTHIVSRATQTNRIKGGTVAIN